jgi:hypothetical protein
MNSHITTLCLYYKSMHENNCMADMGTNWSICIFRYFKLPCVEHIYYMIVKLHSNIYQSQSIWWYIKHTAYSIAHLFISVWSILQSFNKKLPTLAPSNVRNRLRRSRNIKNDTDKVLILPYPAAVVNGLIVK